MRKETGTPGRVWRVGAYIRLSKDDGNDESMSVTNQKKIIRDYLETAFVGEYRFFGDYVDDGRSGTDFDRPAFLRMLRDVENGAIDCVVCKNLSRMFRNYSDQGYFLENVFPRYGIRFVTVSEPKVDSFLHPETIGGLEIPINGLMNDRFAAKTSLDIRDTFAAKRRKGEFIGAFAPYGYQKSPENKNKLIPDQDAAAVVAAIFHWYVYEGMSKNAIARRLNGLAVPNPTAYKLSRGLRYQNSRSGENDGLWSPGTVSAILKNPVYTGTMVQGRQAVISYKVHQKVAVPQERWYVVADTHQAIIPKETFELAGTLQGRRSRTAPGTGKPHLFSGLIRCGDCQKAMHRHSSKGIVYYQCRTYGEKSRNRCAKHSVREDTLSCILLSVLRVETGLGDLTGLADPGGSEKKHLRRRPGNGGGTAWVSGTPDCSRPDGCDPGHSLTGLCRLDTSGLLQSRKRELARVLAVTDHLYEDWKWGEITREEYLRMKARYTGQAETLKAAVQRLTAECTAPAAVPAAVSAAVPAAGEENGPPETQFASLFQDGILRKLNRGILMALVDQILVYGNGEMEIRFAFQDPAGKQ